MSKNNSMQIFWILTLLLMLLILVLVNVNQSFYDYVYLQVFRKLPNEQTKLTVTSTDQIKNAKNNDPKDSLDNVIDNLLLDSEKKNLKDYNLYYINENKLYSYATATDAFTAVTYSNVENNSIKKISKKNLNTFYVMECVSDLDCNLYEFNTETNTKKQVETNIIDYSNRLSDIAVLKINQSPQVLAQESVDLNPERNIQLLLNGIQVNSYTYLQSDLINDFDVNSLYITANGGYLVFNNISDGNIFIYNTDNKSSRILDKYKMLGAIGNILILLDTKNEFYTYNVANDVLKNHTQLTDLGLSIDNNKTVSNDLEFAIHNPAKFNTYVYTQNRDIINIIEGFYPLEIIDNNLIGIKHDCTQNCFAGNEILTSNSRVQIINLNNFETKNLNIPISSIVNFQVIAYEL